jgi:hypothetical protein
LPGRLTDRDLRHRWLMAPRPMHSSGGTTTAERQLMRQHARPAAGIAHRLHHASRGRLAGNSAVPDTPTLRLAQMPGHRYWVERIFEDAKGECGLGDDQALGRRAPPRHHGDAGDAVDCRATRRAKSLDLLSPRDIVDMINATLRRNPKAKRR